MDAGELVPADLTVSIVRQRLADQPADGFILDGFPRTTDQARALGSLLAETGTALDAVVELVEPLGSETLFHLNSGVHSFIARLGAAQRMAPDQKVRAAFNPARFRFFDSMTGQAIA